MRQSEKALARLDVVDKPWEPWELRLDDRRRAPQRRGRGPARRAPSCGAGAFTLGPVDLEIGWAERVAILGPNGSGKSTLLGALLGRVAARRGRRAASVPASSSARSTRRRGVLDGDGAAARRLRRPRPGSTPSPGGVTEARTLLAKFGLGADHVARPAASLSPGERTRATLALLQARGVNCLVLDEPTNHLDLPAIEQLEQAVEAFEGTVLLVTHDRRLLDAVTTTRTLRVDGGRVAESVTSGRCGAGSSCGAGCRACGSGPRPSARRSAVGVAGFARNQRDGSVLLELEGDAAAVDADGRLVPRRPAAGRGDRRRGDRSPGARDRGVPDRLT